MDNIPANSLRRYMRSGGRNSNVNYNENGNEKLQKKDIAMIIRESISIVKVTNVEKHYNVPSGYDSWLEELQENRKGSKTY